MRDWLVWLAEAEAADGVFAAPGYLWLLLIVPALAVGMVLAGRLHDRRLRRIFPGPMSERVRPRGVRLRRAIRDGLMLVALAAGIVALAGPRFDKRVQLVEARGIDLVLVVDLSRSMDAQDVDPSRLERVRREIFDLIDVIEGDRVGLVVFAGGAYPRMPLTADTEALRMLVTEMSSRDFQAQGSALHEAIRVATDLLSRDDESATGRAMLVFSDGEIHDPMAALKEARAARDEGIRIFTMLVGDAPAPIPLGDGNWQQDRQGRQVMSTPSDTLLRDLAQAGGGAFARSHAVQDTIKSMYRTNIRGLLQAGSRGVRPKITWRSAWAWPLGLAVLCGLLGAWLGEGRRRWGMAAGLVLLVLAATPEVAMAGTRAQADQAYRDGRFGEASRILTELANDAPDDVDLLRRLGAARYRAGDTEGAIRAWERQARVERRLRRDTLFDLGNAHARSGRYERALDLYDEVLERGAHRGAEHNRTLVAQELARRQAEQPPEERRSDPQSSDQDESEPSDSAQAEEDDGGAPSDPDQGEQGEPEQGEQGEGDDEQEGEEGEESEPQSGAGEGDPEESDRSDEGEQDTSQDGGQKQAGDDQERLDESRSDGVSTEDLDVDDTPTDAEGSADGAPEVLNPEEQAARQAERLLEGVEEGRPRITIPGGSGDKPW
ncbi:MAG: VWA domain-containing protein [Deltaproteobacteria bacterium]|nr:MAG: VWA domain-containing protein [Deltaproteobacteria bacterium]